MRLWLALFTVLFLSQMETANATNLVHSQHFRHHHHSADAHGHGRSYGDGRPAAWCGWFMRKQVSHDPGSSYNLARNWLNYGTAASGPLPGVIAVWPHHVAMIVGYDNNRHQWITHEGNWRHREHLGPRSLSGVIGWRNS